MRTLYREAHEWLDDVPLGRGLSLLRRCDLASASRGRTAERRPGVAAPWVGCYHDVGRVGNRGVSGAVVQGFRGGRMGRWFNESM